MARLARLKREAQYLKINPTPGVVCQPRDDCLDIWDAEIEGLVNTPYEGGKFPVEITISEKYPFLPPTVRFMIPIYHPNIDVEGRICMSSLKPPPAGDWSPNITLDGLLTSLQLLLASPNPQDPLMSNIANEYLHARSEYEQRAKEVTKKYATG